MIKAVVFDFDGLILDTETTIFLAIQQVYESYAVVLTKEQWRASVGHKHAVFDPHLFLQEALNQTISKEVYEQQFKDTFQALIAQQSLRPGVLEYLQYAKKNGLKIGLASNSDRKWVTNFLVQFKLIDFFEVIKTADDVSSPKPDPELYLTAIDELGVTADQAIAFEDSPPGVRAAKRAGLYCVAVPNEMTEELSFDQYDLRLSSMAEKSLEQIINELEK